MPLTPIVQGGQGFQPTAPDTSVLSTLASKVASGSEPSTRSGSPFSLFGNLISDVRDLGVGIANLGGALVHDLVYNPIQGIEGHGSETKSEVESIVKAVPHAIAKDYSERYGIHTGVLGGHFSQFFKSPLSFITDALIVGDAGVKAADLAAKAGEVGEKAAALGAENVGAEAAMTAPQVLNAGTREATVIPPQLAMDEASRAAQFVARVRGAATPVMTADGRIVEFAGAENPVKRFLLQRPYLAAATDSGSVSKALQTAVYSGEDGLKFAQGAQEFHDILGEAMPGAAAPEVDLPKLRTWAENKYLNKFVDRAVGTAHAARRESNAAFQSDMNEVAKSVPQEVPLDMVDDNARAVDTSMSEDGYAPPGGRGNRITEQFVPKAEYPSDVQELPAGWDTIEHQAPGDVTPSSGVDGWRLETKEGVDPATQAREVAQQDRESFVGKLRRRLGPGVVVDSGPKSVESIGAWQRLTGALPDDVSRIRILLSDADIVDPEKLRAAMDAVSEETGGKLRYGNESIHNVGGDGTRMYRAVYEVDSGAGAHPMEVQFLTPHSAEVEDLSAPLRKDNLIAMLGAKDTPALVPDAAIRITKNNHWLQDLHAGLTDDIRTALGGPADSAARKALQRLHEVGFKHVTGPAIEETGLDTSAAFDNRYAAVRLKNGAEYSKDASVNHLIKGGSPLDHSQLMHESGVIAPSYVPVLPTDNIPRLSAVDVMSPGKDVDKALAAAAKDPYSRATEQVLLRRGDYLKDPFELLKRRAAAMNRAAEGYSILKSVINEVGRPLHSLAEFDPSREVLLRVDDLEQLQHGSTALVDAVLQSPEGKEVGAIQRTLKELYQDPLTADVENARYVAIPKAAVKRIEAFSKYSMPESVRLMAGTPTKLFKQVSLMSPGFLLRHTFRLAAYAWMNDGSLLRAVRLMNNDFFDRAVESLPEELRGTIRSSITNASEAGRSVWSDDSAAGRIANAVQDSDIANGKAVSWLRKPQTVLRTIQTRVEEAFRAEAAMTAVEKTSRLEGVRTWGRAFLKSEDMLDRIYTSGLDESTARAAMEQMQKTLISYDDMGPLERNIVAPYLVPFYPAYKFAARMALQFPIEAPLKATALRIIQEASTVQGPAPDWAKAALALGPDPQSGDMRFLSTAGMNPFHVVSEEPANLLNPILKMMFERATGVDTYTGKEFTAPNVVEVGGKKYQVNPDGTVNEVSKVVPPLIVQALDQVPQYGMVKDLLARGNRTYDTASLLDAINGKGIIIDPQTGDAKYPGSVTDAAASWFGYSQYSYDLTKYQADRIQNVNEALKQYLARQAAPTH